MAGIIEVKQYPKLVEKCYEQEEMRKTLIEKFYELDEIHVDDIEVTPDNVISAAGMMDSIYNTLYPNTSEITVE